jgi:hypothetical protein
MVGKAEKESLMKDTSQRKRNAVVVATLLEEKRENTAFH